MTICSELFSCFVGVRVSKPIYQYADLFMPDIGLTVYLQHSNAPEQTYAGMLVLGLCLPTEGQVLGLEFGLVLRYY